MSPIYELPTRSGRRYTGKYGQRVWSFGHGRGNSAVHIELNNGRRFVALPSAVVPMPSGEYVNRPIWNVLKPCGEIPQMSPADYAGVLFITRLARSVRTGAPFHSHGI